MTTTLRSRRSEHAAVPRRRSGRVPAAAGAYVGAWLIGLALAPASPGPAATAEQVGTYYTEQAGSVVASSLFVHGVAALALAMFAMGLATVTRAQLPVRRAVTVTGLAAALLSVLQMTLALIATSGVQDETALDLFQALNVVDIAKISMLAALIATGTVAMASSGMSRRWLRVLAAVLVPMLPLGSAALLIDNSALMVTLSVSLVLLLIWVAGTGATVRQCSHVARSRSHGEPGA